MICTDQQQLAWCEYARVVDFVWRYGRKGTWKGIGVFNSGNMQCANVHMFREVLMFSRWEQSVICIHKNLFDAKVNAV